jgi:phosphoribosylanthranilate isomerase
MAAVKICGLMNRGDIDAVNHSKPDFAGFVFAPGRRRIQFRHARLLIEELDAAIIPVGVFVNEAVETVVEIVKDCALDVVQLHGEEDSAYISALRWLLHSEIPICKAIRVRDASSLLKADRFGCDMLLLDAWCAGQAGGAGREFDWKLLEGFSRPYFLAGGLNAGNIVSAIELLNPFGVDVSTGVETDGLKDGEKINAFIALARGEKG